MQGHRFFRLCLSSDHHVPRVDAVVPAERFRDRRGNEEHPIQIRAAFAQRFAGDEALLFGLVALLPFQIDVQINSLASAVIGFAEKVSTFGNLPTMFPAPVH